MSESINKYETVIGLEVHIQLNTKTKLFASDPNQYGSAPNENISPLTLAHPGTLPVLNQEAVRCAVLLGLATNCKIAENSFFDRKHYFYPDLPSGYQITQFHQPVCQDGYLEVISDGKKRKIGIAEIHLENDAGKTIHNLLPEHSLIDLNRCGTPLLELVTRPGLRSAGEAAFFLNNIRQLVQYLNISDGNMEEGSLRCDVNISLRLKGETEFGIRTEIKNMNSVRFIKKAIAYERKRQIRLLEKGEIVQRQTLGFDEEKGITYPLREKEVANDYRYFPDPDLPPVYISSEKIEQLKKEMPVLPAERINTYIHQYQLSEYDAQLLTEQKTTADYFEQIIKFTSNYKAAANWLNGPVKAYMNKNNLASIESFPLKAKQMADMIQLIDEGKLSFSIAANDLLEKWVLQKDKEVHILATELNLLVDTDVNKTGENMLLIDEVLNNHPDELKRFLNGKKALFGFFMGEVMKVVKGKMNPKDAKELLQKRLENLKNT